MWEGKGVIGWINYIKFFVFFKWGVLGVLKLFINMKWVKNIFLGSVKLIIIIEFCVVLIVVFLWK